MLILVVSHIIMIVDFIMVGAIRGGLFKARLHVFLMDKVAMDKKGKECHDESKADEDVPDLVKLLNLLEELRRILCEALEAFRCIMVGHQSRFTELSQFNLRHFILLHFEF